MTTDEQWTRRSTDGEPTTSIAPEAGMSSAPFGLFLTLTPACTRAPYCQAHMGRRYLQAGLGAVVTLSACLDWPGGRAEGQWWAAGYNTIAFPIAAGLFYPTLGLVLRPEIAALSISGSSLLVAINALLLKRFELYR